MKIWNYWENTHSVVYMTCSRTSDVALNNQPLGFFVIHDIYAPTQTVALMRQTAALPTAQTPTKKKQEAGSRKSSQAARSYLNSDGGFLWVRHAF